MSRRVLLTGLGPVTGYGVGMDVAWSEMMAGRTALRRISAFDPSGFACQVAGELADGSFRIRDFVPKSYRKSTKVMCRDIELATAAADAAVRDAGLVTRGIDPDTEPTIAPERMGCHIGAGLISSDIDELTPAMIAARAGDADGVDLKAWGDHGMEKMTPLWLLKYLPNMLACHVTIVHECRGPSNTITCAEASAHLSIGESLRVIERDAADACLSGGAESKVNPMAFIRQQMSGRLRTTDGNPEDGLQVRPFDEDADGMLLGEGGGILVLEAEDHAIARGADVYSAVSGFAATQSHWVDATGTRWKSDDPSIADAIVIALEKAKIRPDDIDAITPLGSGVRAVDDAEVRALQDVFGERLASIPLITTVPFFGNCASGNGGISVAIAAKSIREQVLPPRLAARGRGGLDSAAVPARPARLEHVLCMTPSQNGQNAALILSRVEPS